MAKTGLYLSKTIKYFEKHRHFIFSLNRPVKELLGRPQKVLFIISRKHKENFWALKEQKMFEITIPFLISNKPGWPLSKSVKRHLNISFCLSVIRNRFKKRNCWFNLNRIMSYHMVRNKGFLGSERQIFDLVFLDNSKHIEKHYCTKVA